MLVKFIGITTGKNDFSQITQIRFIPRNYAEIA
jgi:hypothetical protein